MITVHVYICHTERQIDRALEQIKKNDSFDRNVIFHTCKYDFSGKIRYIEEKSYNERVPNITPFKMGSKDNMMNFNFYTKMIENGVVSENAIIEVDITFAHPEEAYAVCHISAALNIHAYTERSGEKVYCDSVPPFVKMNENELKVIDRFSYGRKEFTNEDVNNEIFDGKNIVASNRTTKSLFEKEFLERDVLKTRKVGPDKFSYEVTDEGEYMASMNRRSGSVKHNAVGGGTFLFG